MKIERVKTEIQASIDVKNYLLSDEALMAQVISLAERCSAALRSGGKVIFCGNGGSFADLSICRQSSHLGFYLIGLG